MTPLELPAWLITLMNVTQDIKMEPRLASPPPAWTGAMLLEMSASATPYVLGDRGYLCSATMRGGAAGRGGEDHCARPGEHGGTAGFRAEGAPEREAQDCGDGQCPAGRAS